MSPPGRASGASPSLRQRLEYGAARALLGLLGILPFPFGRRAAEAVGMIAGRLVRRWRCVAEQNLRRAMPELDGHQRLGVQRGVFRNLGRVALVLACAPKWDRDHFRKQVEFVGLDHFREAEARGRGVLLLTAHLGNWELGALAHGALVGPMHVMVRPIANELVDGFIESRRRSHGNEVIPKQRSARAVLEVLRANGTVGILADQNTHPEEAVFVDFFGSPAAANRGFARIAQHSRAAVVPAVAWWNERSRRHVIEYGPTLEVDPPDESNQSTLVNSQRFQSTLEVLIRKHPDQWLWIHRRWKTRPPNEHSEAG